MFPLLVETLTRARVAVERLDKFLDSEERVPYVTRGEKGDDPALWIRHGTLSWGGEGNGPDEAEPILRDISVDFPAGQLTTVVGAVGAGKSSLLQALLGEMTPHGALADPEDPSASVGVCGSVAYCAQSAWIMNASVRKNILFGHEFDETRCVVAPPPSDIVAPHTARQSLLRADDPACALSPAAATRPWWTHARSPPTSASFPPATRRWSASAASPSPVARSSELASRAPHTRVRRCLARAHLCAHPLSAPCCFGSHRGLPPCPDADVYILDDVLSAVDAHVARHIFTRCIRGLIRHKTVVLASHQLQFLKESAQVGAAPAQRAPPAVRPPVPNSPSRGGAGGAD